MKLKTKLLSSLVKVFPDGLMVKVYFMQQLYKMNPFRFRLLLSVKKIMTI